MRRRKVRPVHPGEMLRLDFLPDYRLTREQFAASLLLPLVAVEPILDERGPLPEELVQELREQIDDLEDDTRWRYLRRSRESLRCWPTSEILRTEDDMAAYLEMAAEDREAGMLSTAVKDVLSVMRKKCQGKEAPAVDIPRIFNITESDHRIHNPITPEKLATLGAALRLEPGTRVLDLGSGSGEMLCTWARDHGITGTGVDMSRLFSEQARLRAEELGVADQVTFIHGDAAGYVSDEKVGVAACVGATWIAGGVAGTIELLVRSLRDGGIILIGEPFWRQMPPTEDVAKGCLADSIADFLMLPELLASFGHLGFDVVEMVLADQDGWDRYEAAKWLTMRRWLEANPGDELAEDVRAQLNSEPERYAAYTREYLGWGVFALMPQ